MKRYISIAVILAGLICLIMYSPNISKSESFRGNPTVFIHGYKGTYNSFGNLLNRFEKNYKWGRKAAVYHVSASGKIFVTDLNKHKDKPLFIQLIFENNRADFATNAKWLSQVLKHLKRNYQIESINLVGHSMGGIVALKYIQTYQGDEFPLTNKVIAIGSPFDGIYDPLYFHVNKDPAAIDLKKDSAALQLLRTQKKAIPKQVQFLTIGSTGDIVAVPESVRSAKSIIPSNQLREIIIDDKDLSHSALHESEEVDNIIHDFLFLE